MEEKENRHPPEKLIQMELRCRSREGLVADLAAAFTGLPAVMRAMDAQETKRGRSVVRITIGVEDLSYLGLLEERLHRVEDVLSLDYINL